MRKIKILDCTLRDGGYINDWNFGEANIKRIIKNLNQSKIDMIECGFLKDDIERFNTNFTNYASLDDLISLGTDLFISDRKYAVMLLVEKFNIDHLPDRKQNYITIIRLSFHKSDLVKAIQDAKAIKKKGYHLFLQPTATMRYKDEEIIELLKICNTEIKPDSVAIVDTFGEMIGDNIIHYTKLFDQYLYKNITLSFHSHNNLQTAYSNALLFIDNTSEEREIVIDSSIYGMGRGARNLCSELIIDYLNKKFHKEYQLFPILNIVDNILANIKKQNDWGYSLEYYLSAIYHCHPNYCIYYSNKKTLTTCDLQLLLESISENKKQDFDKAYADELYYSYFNKKYVDDNSYHKLKKMIGKKKVLLLGPGKSLEDNKDVIVKLIQDRNEYFVIAINNILEYSVDAYFISNRKRYDDVHISREAFYLFTSNISDNKISDAKRLIFDYQKVLAKEKVTSDNSLLMMLNILKKIYNKEVLLAGFDGYDYIANKNYYKEDLLYLIDKNKVDELNQMMKEYLTIYKQQLDIKFLTKSKYNVK